MPREADLTGVPPGSDGGAGAGAILVVEDNEVNALILGAMLRKLGYQPLMARDGAPVGARGNAGQIGLTRHCGPVPQCRRSRSASRR